MKLALSLGWMGFLALLSLGAEPAIELSDVNGKFHTPLVVSDKKAVVLVFVSPFCPTSNAFAPEVNQITAEYADRFKFYLVEADAKKHTETMEIKSAVLLDAKHQLAHLTKAKTTPEVVVLNGKGETLYQGRINDLYVTQTKKLKEPKTHDLRVALDSIAAGKAVEVPITKAIGCLITFNP